MSGIRFRLAGLAAASMMVLAGAAMADNTQPPYPVDGTACASFGVTGSVDCAGGFANENTTPISNLINVANTETYGSDTWATVLGGTSFNEYKDDDADGGSTNSVIDGNGGTVTFLSAVSGPFVLALKYGNEFSAFLYTTGYNAGGTITYTGDAANKLSHVSLYSVTAVPEPETYALMLAGLAAVGFMARRRRQA